ncbi:hypothetical protein [Actinobacillus succinogenes]|nr:hypothetical protein [Actinobacillus succinogenes]
MKLSKRTFLKSLVAASILAVTGLNSNPAYSDSAESIKLGFLVKQP